MMEPSPDFIVLWIDRRDMQMKEAELIQLLAEALSSNTTDQVFNYIAPDCVYY